MVVTELLPRLVVEDGQVSVSYDPEGDSYSSKYRKPVENGNRLKVGILMPQINRQGRL